MIPVAHVSITYMECYLTGDWAGQEDPRQLCRHQGFGRNGKAYIYTFLLQYVSHGSPHILSTDFLSDG